MSSETILIEDMVPDEKIKGLFTIYYERNGIKYKQIKLAPCFTAKRVEYEDSYFYELYFEVVKLDENQEVKI